MDHAGTLRGYRGGTGVRADGLRGLAGRGRAGVILGYPLVRIRSGIRLRLRDATAVTKHQFGQLVLPCEDKSSEQTFFSAWAFRISSALQRGTALMIHNIPLAN